MILLLLILLSTWSISLAQYVPPSDPLVVQKLKEWGGLKFGLLMHWGTYSQWGIVESWSICPEDEGWTQRNPKYGKTYNEYVKNYENLQTTFNPVQFNPERWAAAAKDAGMKYVVFTTKHHDGFCMFDTKYTDYKITDPKTPFHTNPKANIAKEVFRSFRDQGFMVGVYFSKPDWHSPNYWWPYFPPHTRNLNYDNKRYPERWSAFKNFTHGQIEELVSQYGKVEILWFDGGWVEPINRNQDIDMAQIAAMARRYQPGMLVVDRTVGGEYENYETPEQTIPERPLFHPWESCITLGQSWSYLPDDKYMPANAVIRTLLTIISRGGSLLLNVGPSPSGEWDAAVYDRLRDLGAWMRVNDNAVYNTTTLPPYQRGEVLFSQSSDHQSRFVYLLSDGKNDLVDIPSTVEVGAEVLTPASSITVLGTNVVLKNFDAESGVIHISEEDKKAITFKLYAVVLKVVN